MRQAEVKNNRTDRIEKPRRTLLRENVSWARKALGSAFGARAKGALDSLTREFGFSVKGGDLQIINSNWYVTHTGLLRLARHKRCRGIHVEAVDSLCDSAVNRFVLKATVYPTKDSAGFVGYGDADPSNVSLLVRGAEMRIAETRAPAAGADTAPQAGPAAGSRYSTPSNHSRTRTSCRPSSNNKARIISTHSYGPRSNSSMPISSNSRLPGSSIALRTGSLSTAVGSSAAATTATAFLTTITAATMAKVTRSASTTNPSWWWAGIRASSKYGGYLAGSCRYRSFSGRCNDGISMNPSEICDIISALRGCCRKAVAAAR